MKAALDGLARILHYQFKEEDLLRNALTHRSVTAGASNERLEFLGDSILNFVIAAELFKNYPDAPEGDLSRLRANLVNKDALARLAGSLQLGEWLLLGSGEMKSGGVRRKSILADALEAIFGAVYLDGGFAAAKKVILRLYQALISDSVDPEGLKDPKTRLQEHLQSRKIGLPVYELMEVSGKPHAQTFKVKCLTEKPVREFVGQGSSRRKAEQQAAQAALESLLKKKS